MQLKFGANIVETSLHLDIIILSEASKQLALIELMVPSEDHKEDAFEGKLAKYEGLVMECWRQDSRERFYPVEVGSRGFTGESLYKASTLLDMSLEEQPSKLQQRQQREFPGGCGSRGIICGLMLLGRKSGPDQPQLGHQGEGDLKQAVNPGYITADASSAFIGCIFHL